MRSSDNFGVTGEAPSHPELLDDLAVRFMEEGWNLRRLVKELVMSRTYRMSSEAPVVESDPDNRLLARMNRKRLDAECLRDAMLAGAGVLETPWGGPNIADAKAVDSNDTGVQNLEYNHPFDDRRRSVYTAAFRNVRHPLFEVFDFADINQPVAQRTTSTIAPQALYLMNHPQVIELARTAAGRLPLDGPRDAALREAYRAGFRVEAEGKVVAIAGDTVPCEGLNRICEGADIYVQTVILRSFIEKHPRARFRDVIDYHSDVEQAAQTAQACGVRTLVLNHPVPPPQPGTEATWIELAKRHFDGEIVLANDLLSLEA